MFLPVFVHLDSHELVRNDKVALEHVARDGAPQRPALGVRHEIGSEGGAFKGHAIRSLDGIDKGYARERANEFCGLPMARLRCQY